MAAGRSAGAVPIVVVIGAAVRLPRRPRKMRAAEKPEAAVATVESAAPAAPAREVRGPARRRNAAITAATVTGEIRR